MDTEGWGGTEQLDEGKGGSRHGGGVCVPLLYESRSRGSAQPTRHISQPCPHLQGAVAPPPGAPQWYFVYIYFLSLFNFPQLSNICVSGMFLPWFSPSLHFFPCSVLIQVITGLILTRVAIETHSRCFVTSLRKERHVCPQIRSSNRLVSCRNANTYKSSIN